MKRQNLATNTKCLSFDEAGSKVVAAEPPNRSEAFEPKEGEVKVEARNMQAVPYHDKAGAMKLLDHLAECCKPFHNDQFALSGFRA